MKARNRIKEKQFLSMCTCLLHVRKKEILDVQVPFIMQHKWWIHDTSLQNRTDHWLSAEFLENFSFHPEKAFKILQMNCVLFVYT